MWAPPVISWSINPMNTIVIWCFLRIIKPSYWSYLHQLSYCILWGPHTVRYFTIINHWSTLSTRTCFVYVWWLYNWHRNTFWIIISQTSLWYNICNISTWLVAWYSIVAKKNPPYSVPCCLGGALLWHFPVFSFFWIVPNYFLKLFLDYFFFKLMLSNTRFPNN